MFKIADYFDDATQRRYGVRRGQALSAAARPDAVEHLTAGPTGERVMSIYLRRVLHVRPPRWIMVVAAHLPNGDQLIDEAWMLPETFTDGLKPLQILRRLAEQCGYVVQIGSLKGKFILNSELNHHVRPVDVGIEGGLEGRDVRIKAQIRLDSTSAKTHVSCAYALDPFCVRQLTESGG